jgi:N-hydroxyarylamine O-acetyltransferase
LNPERYFDRIELPPRARDGLQPNHESLCLLTRLHTRAIPFENLNTLMGVPVALDLEALETKLVGSRRGGYCFEHNGLFAAVLEQIGFFVTRLSARVVWGLDADARGRNPRTHMVLLVRIGNRRYLCDVGFGGVTPTAPLELDTQRAQQTPHESFRLSDEAGGYVLRVGFGGDWHDVYGFDLQPQMPSDYEMANHYVATHPASHFRTTLIAARAFDGGRHMLRNRRLSTYTSGEEKRERQLSGPDELMRTLEELFGIAVAEPGALAAVLANLRE